MLSQADIEMLAAQLKRWSERPIAPTNLRVAGISALTLAFMILAAARTPDPTVAARGMAMILVVLQSIAHVVTTAMLRALTARGVSHAAAALASYRDPRRLSGLDMAMSWVVVALAAPLFAE